MAVIEQADLLLVLGARLSDITTQGYTFPKLVRPSQRLVHVHNDPTVIGTHFASDLSIACAPVALMEAVGRPDRTLPDRDGWIRQLGEERRRIAVVREIEVDDGLPFEHVVDLVGRHLPKDAIVTLDAGTFAAPAYRVIDFNPPQRLIAPISGAMGFGIPAAVAACLRDPGRTVICFVGDGGFLMTGSELAVAMERRLPLKVVVSENKVYGSIKIHQEKQYPGRSLGVDFVNPDLEVMGRAYGFPVTRISRLSQLPHLIDVLAAPGPQFVVVDTSVKAVLQRPALR